MGPQQIGQTISGLLAVDGCRESEGRQKGLFRGNSCHGGALCLIGTLAATKFRT